MSYSAISVRRTSIPVKVGHVTVGGGAPVVVQSMTNTDTADAEATARQTADLARAGSELVRITVDRDDSARAVPHIREKLDRMGCNVPLVGDFHYNGHTLLNDHPACAEALAKYRINPGNVGLPREEGPQLLDDGRDGDQVRPAGSDRRQLGFARSGTADGTDGPERQVRNAARRARGHARGRGAVRPLVGRACHRDRACRRTASSSRPNVPRCRI